MFKSAVMTHDQNVMIQTRAKILDRSWVPCFFVLETGGG
jgi:hypothetical protein